MRTFSQGFREAIRGIRKINVKIDYQSKDETIVLTTEGATSIRTEKRFKLFGTEKGYKNLDKEHLIQVNPLFNCSFLKTGCGSLLIESTLKIPKKTWVHCEIGVKVGNSFEYMDFGKFRIIDEPTYNADTGTYTAIAYDRMIEAMVKYDISPLNVAYPISHKNLLIAICDKFGWKYNLPSYDAQNIMISEDIYKGLDMTYRDILDDLCVVTGGSFLFNLQDEFTIKKTTETNEVVIDEDLRNTNVDLGDIYGPVNSVSLALDSDGNALEIIGEDASSISQNGKTEMVLYSKLLLSSSGSNFFTSVFNNIKGLQYCISDFDSTGLLIFEPLDKFNVTYKNVNYPCILFNDDIKVSQGLVETIYSEIPEENKDKYTTSTPKDNQLKDAIVEVNKAKGQLVLKATADGRVVETTLNADAEEGTEFNVKADNIRLEGYTTINGNFEIDNSGNMKCQQAEVSGTIYANNGIVGSATIDDEGIYTGNGNGTAGIGKAGSRYAFWAGSNVNDTFNAPFRVDHDGNLYSNSASITGGLINITSNHGNPKLTLTGTSYGGSSSINKIVADGIIVTSNSQDLIYARINQISSGGSTGYGGVINLRNTLDNRFATADYDGFSTGTGGYPNAYMYSDGEVYARVYSGGSLESIKKNIELYSDEALNIINHSDIYEYNLKNEEDSNKKHIGLVIGDGKKEYNTPKEIITPRGDGVDLYSMVSLSWKAIQEQQKEIEKLKEELEVLRNGHN